MTSLRRAGPADLDAIAALETACFSNSEGGFSRRQLRALLRNPRAHWLLSADKSAMACWLAVSNGRARWARLYSLAVHPAARGQGWGTRLLRAVLRDVRREGFTVCRAEVRKENRVARALYARHGFAECGSLRDYYAPGRHGVRLERRDDP